ncbi:Maltose/maltodextrin ABC transporter, permease protein MalF [Rubellimicrobium mesophilum DSM 19309]|uniref:Maltose/maltodextrin ABC transporter, permease protein MalF n=1 Tax=Rubellimicrobium mesophilum DSM 19309 TaxID=442562 RepID=A0A017HID0_9RHOB|nr:sugar ABC transporter permease [Rubellimicrobium mesophilum]EYD74101.1 Maltose/maltodextrin ABC transporter, permease protein MalF [Rubellimicrobium mesophilum DSM 19309]
MTTTVTTAPGARASGKEVSLQQQRARAAFWFLAPMLVMLVIVAAWPLFRSIMFSFTDATSDTIFNGQSEWVGFENYLTWRVRDNGEVRWRGVLADPDWWNAVWNTVRFSLISVSLETILGLLVALVLNAEFKGRGFVRAAILIPWAIPTIVSAKMWGWMLNDQFGIINNALMALNIIDTPIAWTARPDTAMIAVLIVDVWKTTPFMALLMLAGLQMIPRDMYEAARIDGIHPVKVFFRLTLPLLKPALMVAVIFRVLDALRIFDLIYVLTPRSEGTVTMSVISYLNLQQFGDYGEGSAQSTLLFLIIAVFVLLYIWLGRVDLSGERSK